MSTKKSREINLEAFQAAFSNMTTNVFKNIATDMDKIMGVERQQENSPRVMTAREAAKFLIGRKKITILTGAGISAASGIPTFRGQDGFWKEKKRYAGEADPTEICTRKFFNKNPMANWEWHYEFIKLM